MIGDLEYTAFLVTPGRELDKRITIRCHCGYMRDCGYMDITAERLASQHEEATGHTVVTHSEPAPPLTRQTIKKKLQNKRPASRKMFDLTLPGD